MTEQEFWSSFIRFANIGAVYYVVQLVRCVLFSFLVFAFISVLRKTALKNKVFLKGAIWSLFIPVLFIGKLKFFYENRIGIKLFSGLTEMCMNHIWICWLYLCGVFVYAALLFYRRRKVKRMVAGIEKRDVSGTVIYVTKMPVTPSAAGVFRPKIVMPEVILEEYDREELQTILLHEKTHIRLGHLWLYFLWDILRVLLWLNPFLAIGTKYFREDMEEICDWVTIRKSRDKAYAYGQLLLKSMRVLQAESEDFNMYATFAGDKEYRNIRQRVTRIAGYRPYRRSEAVGILIAAVICVAGMVFWTKNVSYGRYESYDSIAVYDAETGEVLVNNSEALSEIVTCDGNYIYIDVMSLRTLIKDSNVQGNGICFYYRGYSKLPGIGGGGGSGYVRMEELKGDVYKITYEKQEDIFMQILKFL